MSYSNDSSVYTYTTHKAQNNGFSVLVNQDNWDNGDLLVSKQDGGKIWDVLPLDLT